MAEKINEMRALNTTERPCVGPACGDGHVNGTIAPGGGHSAPMGEKYDHWCRPEPTKEMPWKSSDLERAKEKQGGMQEDTEGLRRASNGGVIGSQKGARDSGPRTNWGEYHDVNQWDKSQAGTYRGEKGEPFDD